MASLLLDPVPEGDGPCSFPIETKIRWRRQKIVDSLRTGTDDPNCEIEIIGPTKQPMEETVRYYDVETERGVYWYLDIYGLDPPRHLRVDPRRFDFHSLGEQMAPTQEHNLHLLVERLTRAAPDVPVTPGVVSLLAGEGQDRHTFQDLRHFERRAAWYLTRLRATKILHDAAPSAVPEPPLNSRESRVESQQSRV